MYLKALLVYDNILFSYIISDFRRLISFKRREIPWREGKIEAVISCTFQTFDHNTNYYYFLCKAMSCSIGQEPDPESHNRYRWVIPVEDPCQCTQIQLGGVNTRTPCRPFNVTYYDTFLHSNNTQEIQQWLNCSGTNVSLFWILNGSNIQSKMILLNYHSDSVFIE